MESKVNVELLLFRSDPSSFSHC